jgi:hypothetical protein
LQTTTAALDKTFADNESLKQLQSLAPAAPTSEETEDIDVKVCIL